MASSLRFAFAVVAALAANAFAHPISAGDDSIPAPPPTYHGNGVAVEEHLGAKIPLDAKFTTSDGKQVTLGDLIKGDLPTILTFNYSDCPMLCSLELNGLTAALPNLGILHAGQQFRIVTIDLEPNEPVAKLAKMKQRYIERMSSASKDAGGEAQNSWTFLTADGDAAAIRRVADAVGFKYAYVPERAEWAHPAGLIFLSSAGAVTRYVYGIEFQPGVMADSILKAGQAEASTSAGFMYRCYHYDPDANSHAHAGVLALRYGAAGFIVLLGTALALAHFVRKQKRPDGEVS